MTIVLGYRNQRYDDAEPLYCTTGTEFVFNRHTGRLITHESLVASMALDSYTLGANEMGVPSYEWQQLHSTGPQISWGEGIGGDVPASNTVTNGELWSDASGVTPPTGWTDAGAASYGISNGVLTIANAAAGVDSMTQTQTILAETAYVAYIGIVSAEGVATVSVDGNVTSVSGPGTVRVEYSTVALDVDADIVLAIDGIGHIEVDYVRNILATDEV